MQTRTVGNSKQSSSTLDSASCCAVEDSVIRSIFLKNKNNELFIADSADLQKAKEEYQASYEAKEERRNSRFCARLERVKSSFDAISTEEYRAFGKKGFSIDHRAQVYEHLLNLSEFEAKYGTEYFSKCLKTDIPSSIGRVIQADIPRTLSSFVSTCGEVTRSTLMKMLRDVLWSFAVHKPEIGYCQSMNFIAAYFISVFGSAKKSFYALVQFIDSPTSPYVGLHIPAYYAPGMTQLLSDIGVLDLMVRRRIGEKNLREFFQQREISSLSLIVSEWFLTCFITVFPLRTVQRLMDYFVSNAGGSSKVLFRIAFVILREIVNRKHELFDLDQVMQGHKRITREWVKHNELVVAATRGIRMFSKRDVDEWRRLIASLGRSGSACSISADPMGTTMMRLEEAIAQRTTTALSVPEDGILDLPDTTNSNRLFFATR